MYVFLNNTHLKQANRAEVMLMSHRVVFPVSCPLLLILPRMNAGLMMKTRARARRKRCASVRFRLRRSTAPMSLSPASFSLLRIPHQNCCSSHIRVRGLKYCGWKRGFGYSPFKTFTYPSRRFYFDGVLRFYLRSSCPFMTIN